MTQDVASIDQFDLVYVVSVSKLCPFLNSINFLVFCFLIVFVFKLCPFLNCVVSVSKLCLFFKLCPFLLCVHFIYTL